MQLSIQLLVQIITNLHLVIFQMRACEKLSSIFAPKLMCVPCLFEVIINCGNMLMTLCRFVVDKPVFLLQLILTLSHIKCKVKPVLTVA